MKKLLLSLTALLGLGLATHLVIRPEDDIYETLQTSYEETSLEPRDLTPRRKTSPSPIITSPPRKEELVESKLEEEIKIPKTLEQCVDDFGTDLEDLHYSFNYILPSETELGKGILFFGNREIKYNIEGKQLYLTIPFENGGDLNLNVHFEEDDRKIEESWLRATYEATDGSNTLQFKASYGEDGFLKNYTARKGNLQSSSFIRGDYFTPAIPEDSNEFELSGGTMYRISDFLRFVTPIVLERSR